MRSRTENHAVLNIRAVPGHRPEVTQDPVSGLIARSTAARFTFRLLLDARRNQIMKTLWFGGKSTFVEFCTVSREWRHRTEDALAVVPEFKHERNEFGQPANPGFAHCVAKMSSHCEDCVSLFLRNFLRRPSLSQGYSDPRFGWRKPENFAKAGN